MAADSEIENWYKQNNPNSEIKKTIFLQGKYEIIERVGAGGMGKVYHGRDIYLKREVAIKEFSPESPNIDPKTWQELEAAFQREATLLANLRHESLPTIFDFFTEDYRNYLVMEFVEGDDLQKRAKELREKYDGQFPVNKVRRWAEDLLEVLIYLHDRESPIYHRDIKPANLKLRNDKICLLDFGLAKGSARNLSAFSGSDKTLFGFTHGFAPLEQMHGEKTTVQTDIYGLSATIYYLLIGEIPIDGWTRRDDIKNGKVDPLLNVKSSRPGIDNGFAEIIMQGLAIEPHSRPKNVREMLEILRRGENENNSKFKDSTVTSFFPSDTQSTPPNNIPPMTNPMQPNPPILYNPTPLIESDPNPSKRRTIIFSIVGGAVFCVVAVVGIILFILINDGRSSNNNSNNSSNNSSNQPLLTGSSNEKRLLSDQKLYERPSLVSDATSTLSKGAKVQVDHTREESSGTWYKVKSGSKEGWILCKGESNTCFGTE